MAFPLTFWGQDFDAKSDHEIEELLDKLDENISHLQRLSLLKDITHHYYYSDTDKAQIYAGQGYEFAKEYGKPSDIAYFLHLWGSTQLIAGENMVAIQTFQKAIKLGERIGDTIQVKTYSRLGIAYQAMLEFEMAQKAYARAIFLADSMNMPEARIVPLGMIGNLLGKKGNYEKAISIHKEALILSTELGKDNLSAYQCKDLAREFLEIGKPDSALIYGEKALYITEVKNNMPFIAARAHIAISEIYISQHKYDLAIDHASTSKNIADTVRSSLLMVEALSILSNAYLESNRIDQSLIYAYELQQISKNHDQKEYLGKSYHLLQKLYAKKNNYKNAYKYKSLEAEIETELAVKKQSNLLELAQQRSILYEKESENEVLRDEIVTNKKQLQKSNIFSLMMATFFLLVLIAAYLLYRKNQSISESNPIRAVLYKENRKIALVKQIAPITLLITLPIVVYFFIWDFWNQIILTIVFDLTLLINYFLATKKQSKAIFWLSMCFYYPFISVIPFHFGTVYSISLSLIAILLFCDYLAPNSRLRIINSLFFILNFLAFSFIFSKAQHSPTPPEFEAIIGVTCSLAIILVLFYTNKDIQEFQDEMVKNQHFLRQIADLNPHFVFAKNKDRQFTFVNQAMANTYHREDNEIIGKTIEEVHPFFKEHLNFKEADLSVLSSGESLYRESDYIMLSPGEAKWVETIKKPLFTPSGQVIGLLGVATDITERKKAKEKLEKSEKKYRDIFEYSHHGIIILDLAERKPIDCNPQILKIIGCETKEEFLQKPVTDFLAPIQFNGEDRLSWMKWKFEDFVANGRGDYTFIGKTFQGETFIGEETIISDCSKGQNHAWIFINDITETFNAQQNTLERTSILEALVHHSFNGIDIIEITYSDLEKHEFQGKLLIRNEQMKFLAGTYKDDPLISSKKLVALSPEMQPNGLSTVEAVQYIAKKLIAEKHIMYYWTLQNENNEFIHLEVVAHLIRVNRKTFLIRIHKEITNEKRQMEIIQEQVEDLNAKNEQLKRYIESNLQLENFAYIASHDLKAPIRTIISFTQLLQKNLQGKMDDREKEFFQFIVSASNNMQRMVNDLLDYSRINSTQIAVTAFDPCDLLCEIQRELGANIEDKQAIITLHELPETIYGDRTKLRKVFQNLITNALKFQQKDRAPRIKISAESRNDHWIFTVKDNGIGIEEVYQEKIFLLFRRLHSESKYTGTGIGLAICKKIVEQHHGDIGVNSSLGDGSEFYFSISKNLQEEAEINDFATSVSEYINS